MNGRVNAIFLPSEICGWHSRYHRQPLQECCSKYAHLLALEHEVYLVEIIRYYRELGTIRKQGLTT